MGIDCEILFQTSDGADAEDVVWRPSWGVEPPCETDLEEYPGCTHYVYTLCRYFGPYYTRGFWPEILFHLVQLMRSPSVVKVWYGGDCGLELQEVNEELILGLTSLYISGKNT